MTDVIVIGSAYSQSIPAVHRFSLSAISCLTRACNASRRLGHCRSGPKFRGPKAPGSNSDIVDKAIAFSSPLQHKTRRSVPVSCATSAISCRQDPQGVTICAAPFGSVNLKPTTAIASRSKSPAALAEASAEASAQIERPKDAFSRLAPDPSRFGAEGCPYCEQRIGRISPGRGLLRPLDELPIGVIEFAPVDRYLPRRTSRRGLRVVVGRLECRGRVWAGHGYRLLQDGRAAHCGRGGCRVSGPTRLRQGITAS